MESAEKRLLLPLGDAITLFLLLAGEVWALLSVGSDARSLAEVLTACGVFAAASAALYTWRYGGLAALGLLAGCALGFWRMWEDMTAVWPYLLPPDLTDLLRRQDAMLLAVAVLALLMGWVVVRARCWYLAALMVTVPLLPAILSGILPDWTALMAASAGWLSMLTTSLYSRRDRAALGRGTLVNLCCIGALLALLTVLLPQEGYERPQWATNARNSLVSAAAQMLSGYVSDWDAPDFLKEYLSLGGAAGTGSGSGPAANFAVGTDGTVDLRTAGPRRYGGATILQISGAQPGTNYLLGGTAAVYTGSAWKRAGPSFYFYDSLYESFYDSSAFHPALFPARTAPDTETAVMSIRSMYAGTQAYTPYRLWSFPEGNVELLSDGSAIKSQAIMSYQAAYRPGGPADGFTPLPGKMSAVEEFYRAYVYENYLSVPFQTYMALQSLLDAQGADLVFEASPDSPLPEAHQSPLFIARWAAQVLSRAAVYDLSTPAMEQGEDFVEHFLAEGRGYCVHFATAGAMLLRMEGVPARYATGYVFEADRQGNARVKDSGAHAWVEVYLDGYGWYPVEMTPGYAGTLVLSDGTELFMDDAPQTPEEEEEPDQPEEEPDQPEEVPEDAPGPVEAPPQEDGEAPTKPEVREPLDLSWLWRAAAVLLVLAAPFALYRLGLLRRQKLRTLPDTNRSCIAAYRRCRRLLRWGGEEDPVLEDLARKAKFSQHVLTEEERCAAWACLDRAAGRLGEGLPPWKRLAFRCVKPVY